VHDLQARPRSAWRQVELKGVSRLYKTPRILDQQISLPDYSGPIRQKVALRGAIAITGLGHEEPTLLLTNQLHRSAPLLKVALRGAIERYAQRKVALRGAIDALSSAVALKINCDIQLTLMASSLYRHLAQRKVAVRGAIGHGYESAKSQHLFRDLKVALRGAIDATAHIEIDEHAITVHYQRRAHNPLLLGAGFQNTDVFVPWLDRHLRFKFS